MNECTPHPENEFEPMTVATSQPNEFFRSKTAKGWSSRAAIALAASLALAGCHDDKEAAGAGAHAGGPMPVGVVTVQASDIPVSNQWVATLDGYVNAQIQPQVSGYLLKQTYTEGAQVAKGQVLFQIDQRPFQALLDQAQGQLEQAKAAYSLAQINVNRDTPLVEQHAIAKAQLDTETQQMAQALATVKSAEASVATAKLNLGFTQVRSLISGVAGQATTQVGNLVSPQSTLTSVSQLDPIKVYFSLGDQEYLALTKKAHAGDSLLNGAARIPLTLTLSNGSEYPHKGHIVFVDRQMNAQTGAIRIAASFPNPGNVLRPGQFGRVSGETDMHRGAILVPQLAIMDTQGIQQVMTVGSDNKAHVVNVKLGAQQGTDYVVESGLTPGSKVIVDNLQKLAEGVPVSPHAAQLPAAAPTQPSAEAGR